MKNEIKNMESETLIARYLLGSATAIEQQQLLEWLRASEQNQEQFMQLKRISESCTQLSGTESYDVDAAIAHFDRSRTSITPSKRSNIRRLVIFSSAVAATVALMVGVYVLHPSKQEFMLTADAAKAVVAVQLPDSSTVTLNKFAQLYRSESFKNERTVRLNGEAYFAVSHDATHPFVVESDELKIKVLGTEFNVHPSEDKTLVTVTVESGRVMVMHDKISVIVNKGEQVVYNKKNKTLEKTLNENENYISWKTGKLFFNDTPLSEVVKQLNEHYDVQYTIGSPSLDSCRLNASFDFKDVKRVSEFLSIMLKVTIKEENNKLVLYDRAKK